MKNIVIASNNFHKIFEFNQLAKEYLPEKIKFLPQSEEIPFPIEVDENGKTFEENAFIKAHTIAQHTDKFVIADDSGLVVEALNGEPGIFSARYAHPNHSDKNNRLKVLDKLRNVPAEKRRAYFICIICLHYDKNITHYFEGRCYGTIINEERGSLGFGYDPIFIPDGYEQTFAELPTEVKNKISHRGLAARDMMKYLSENI